MLTSRRSFLQAAAAGGLSAVAAGADRRKPIITEQLDAVLAEPVLKLYLDVLTRFERYGHYARHALIGEFVTARERFAAPRPERAVGLFGGWSRAGDAVKGRSRASRQGSGSRGCRLPKYGAAPCGSPAQRAALAMTRRTVGSK